MIVFWRLVAVGTKRRRLYSPTAASYLHTSTSTSTTTSSFQVTEHSPILVRDFIHQALYDPQHGYFSAKPEAVGIMSEPISFNAIKGRRHYMQHLHDLYKQSDVSWFTPVELFKPWYGYAISRYMLANHDRRFPLQIFEIGGGTGTCAKNILDYIKLEAPGVYDNMRYISVEISRALARIQLASVHTDDTHRSRFSVECRDACDKRGWGKVNGHPCFVIMLEVLDNQPHDLIYKENPDSAWMETRLSKRPTYGKLVEMYQPVKDPLVQRCINILDYGSKPTPPWLVTLKSLVSKVIPLKKKIWISTATLQLLETLYTCRPNMSLIVSDFDALPDVKVEGVCAPLVSRKVLHVFNYPCTKTFYYHHKRVHYIISLYLLVGNLNPAPSGFRESGYGVYIIFLPLRFFQKLVFSYAKMMLEQKDGSTEDLNSYLDVKGDADIFFPTDFQFLRKMDIHCSTILHQGRADIKKGFHQNIVSTSSFMKRYGDISRTQTQSSFNPLIDDYSNMKFYLSRPI